MPAVKLYPLGGGRLSPILTFTGGQNLRVQFQRNYLGQVTGLDGVFEVLEFGNSRAVSPGKIKQFPDTGWMGRDRHRRSRDFGFRGLAYLAKTPRLTQGLSPIC